MLLEQWPSLLCHKAKSAAWCLLEKKATSLYVSNLDTFPTFDPWPTNFPVDLCVIANLSEEKVIVYGESAANRISRETRTLLREMNPLLCER